ncbi:MAG: hypothetical protein M1832_005317 [Thelocarpon impressellum]|nr:MAG: hypothetical protein M1832_005317 [Thelocarpon impressellum]
MAQAAFKKSDLVVFDGTVAGHDGVLSDASGEVVVKPCTPAEVAFYEAAKASHPAFAAYMPTYMGSLELAPEGESTSLEDKAASLAANLTGEPPGEDSIAEINAAKDALTRGRALTTNLCIVLSNATAGFKRPNILDLKLGAKLYDESADAAKRARFDAIAAETTTGSLGFRIAGMKVYHGASFANKPGFDAEGYKVFDKMFGRSFSADNIKQGLEEYLLVPSAGVTPALSRPVLTRFAAEVAGIQAMLAAEESRMVGASILFVYEGDGAALSTALSASPSTKPGPDEEGDEDEETAARAYNVKMIDFAHAAFVPGQGPDENVLVGVRNVARLFGELPAASSFAS